MFYAINKLALVVFYAVTAATFFTDVPGLTPEAIHWMRVTAVVLLVAHTLELVIFRSKIALYRGPLAVSMVLTVLFGLLHWKPLADAQRR